MTTATISKRGRPKGTGLDDRDHLHAIAVLIYQSKDLKPTTAIKSLGITNPSTVRRLRDKFNSQKETLLSQVEGMNSKKQQHQKENNKFSELDVCELDQSIKVLQSVSEKTTPASVITCALSKKKDHMIVGENLPKEKKKKKKKLKKTHAEKRVQKTDHLSLKNKSEKTKIISVPAKQSSNENAPHFDAPMHPMNLFNAWFELGAHIVQTTIKTQLQIVELTEKATWYQESLKLQTQARDAWLCSMTPLIEIRHSGDIATNQS